MIRRRGRAALGWLLASVILLGACGRQSAEPDGTAGSGTGSSVTGTGGFDPEERFGPENYDADIAVLRLEQIPEIGEGIVYREPSSLESLIARSSEPIVLCIYDEGQSVLTQVIPYMEQLAADHAAAAVVIMASNESKDPFLTSFDQRAWPAFYVIRQSSVVRTSYGLDENTMNIISRELAGSGG